MMTLFSRRNTDLTHIWLGFFLLSQAGISGFVLLLYGERIHLWSITHIPWIFKALELTFWCEGPLLLLYTRSALYQQLHFNKHDLILLVPLFLYLISLVIVNIQFETEQGTQFLLFIKSTNVLYYEHIRNITRISFGLWAFFTIQGYQNKITLAYSNPESVNYVWLKLLIMGYVVLRLWCEISLLIFTLVSTIFGAPAVDLINLLGVLTNYGQLSLISILLFFALSDPRNILRVKRDIFKCITATNQQTTYSIEQVIRLKNHMKKNRPYLNNQLKIDDLALQVSLSPKLLSTLINREFKLNFFEYVNCFRLKEVKTYLCDENKAEQTILELAFLAGYNSKTSFNRLFKLGTGRTPTQFRKENSKKTT